MSRDDMVSFVIGLLLSGQLNNIIDGEDGVVVLDGGIDDEKSE